MLTNLASTNSELVDPLSADAVLADSAAADPAVVVSHLRQLVSVDPVLVKSVQVDSVPNDLSPVDPVLVKSRPTDPRRGAVSSAQRSRWPAPPKIRVLRTPKGQQS